MTTPCMFAAREGNSITLASILESIPDASEELSKQDEHGNTALHLAALTTGNALVATAMMKATPSTSREWALILNSNGNSALHIASFYDSTGTFVKALLADETVLGTLHQEAPNGHNALHLAVSHGVVEVIEILINFGAMVDETSIEIAESKGHEEVKKVRWTRAGGWKQASTIYNLTNNPSNPQSQKDEETK